MTNKQFVQAERQFTTALLEKLTIKQWQASTLCEGWTVEDLAAHLVVREGLIAPIGIVIHAFHGIHDRSIRRAESKGHGYLIRKIQRYPWYIPAVANTAEFWVHNEDLLRGGLHMSRSASTDEQSSILWGSVKGIAKVKKGLVADLGKLTLLNTRTNETLVIQKKNSKKETCVSGESGELLLYIYGRRQAAQVTIERKNYGKS